MARVPFKLKSGNASAFKNLGSSPARNKGHGVEEEHGHFENGKVDRRTLSNRYSEFNKKQIELDRPTKVVVTNEKGARGWHWSNKPQEFNYLGPSTSGERRSDINEWQNRNKEGGIGVAPVTDNEFGTNKSDLTEVTKMALIREHRNSIDNMSKKELLKNVGKKGNIFNQIFSSKENLKKENRKWIYKDYKNKIMSQAMTTEDAEKYNSKLDEQVSPEIKALATELANKRKENNPNVDYVGK